MCQHPGSCCRTELEAGQYSVVVLGYALETQYELTVDLVETPRELRPAAALALGQVRGLAGFMLALCSAYLSSTTLQK